MLVFKYSHRADCLLKHCKHKFKVIETETNFSRMATSSLTILFADYGDDDCCVTQGCLASNVRIIWIRFCVAGCEAKISTLLIGCGSSF